MQITVEIELYRVIVRTTYKDEFQRFQYEFVGFEKALAFAKHEAKFYQCVSLYSLAIDEETGQVVTEGCMLTL